VWVRRMGGRGRCAQTYDIVLSPQLWHIVLQTRLCPGRQTFNHPTKSFDIVTHFFTAQSIRKMIRREPTMIPMSAADVQDVRDLVAAQTAEYDRKQLLMNHMKIMAQQPLTDEEVPILMHAARQEKDRLERERRLGMEPGTSAGQTDASISAHPQPGPGATDRGRITGKINLFATVKLYGC
jgi:hypothetical protein